MEKAWREETGVPALGWRHPTAGRGVPRSTLVLAHPGQAAGALGRGGGVAHVELALHRGLVDPVEGTVSLALAAGEVEEIPDGGDAGPGVPHPFHSEVLGEVGRRWAVDTR